MNIQPHYLPLAKLFENRLFRIPHYQRVYSWKKKQRSDMLEDIRKLKGNPDNTHFMSTVVGLRRDTKPIGTDSYTFIEVVDGQQRLTTLVLLLKTIERKLKSLLTEADWREQNPDGQREREKLQNLLVNPADKTQILLQTNHDLSQYFANYLKDGRVPPASEVVKTLADKELLSAISDCKVFVNEWDNIFELLRIIKNQLWFIFHESAEAAAGHKVFEVLNNRGLYVSWVDRLKSMLMGVVFENNPGNRDEQIKTLQQIWRQIYETVGLREGLDTEALRFAATLRGSSGAKPVGEEDAVSLLMKQVGTDAAKTIEVSDWLLEVTKAVKRVDEEMRPSRAVVIKVSQVRLLAVAILLRNFTSEEERKLLNQWEKTCFRIFGLCRKDARTGVGDYVRLARKILNEELRVDDILEQIKKLGKSYSFGSIKVEDCYTDWTDELRYLLCRYEEHLADKPFSNALWNQIWKESSAQSIEHIYPQSKASHLVISVHQIGNLLLLPPNLNSRLRDKDPEVKACAYRNESEGLISAAEVAKIIENDGWDSEQIAGRSCKIAEWVDDEFTD